MSKNHLSRLNAPNSWPIRKKGIKFVRRPNPGAHTLKTSMPLSLVLTTLLKYVRTSREVRKILHESQVLVNGKVRKDQAYPVGPMDVISLPKLKEAYRLLYTEKGKFMLEPLSEKEKNFRAVKIKNKTNIKGGKTQINFTDGTNLLVEKDVYKTEDTLILSLKDSKIEKQMPLKEGTDVYLTGGNSIGKVAKVVALTQNLVTIKVEDKEVDTARRFAFVVEGLEVRKTK